jgi:hypothetical protein
MAGATVQRMTMSGDPGGRRECFSISGTAACVIEIAAEQKVFMPDDARPAAVG